MKTLIFGLAGALLLSSSVVSSSGQQTATLPGSPWPSIPLVTTPTLVTVRVQPIQVLRHDDVVPDLPFLQYGQSIDWIYQDLLIDWEILPSLVVRSDRFADLNVETDKTALMVPTGEEGIDAVVRTIPQSVIKVFHVMSMTPGTPRTAVGTRAFAGASVVMFHNHEPYFFGAQVYAHELGHALGLGHSDDPKNLMSARIYSDSFHLDPLVQGPIVWQRLRGTLGIVQWTDPSRPALSLCRVGNEGACLAWHSPPGYTFTIEESLDLRTWISVPENISRPSTGWADTIRVYPISDPTLPRFYRVYTTRVGSG